MIQTRTVTETKGGGTPEYLSKDILDADFVGIFKFYHSFQYILGSCRVEAKDQFVTSPTRYQKAYTILCIIAVLALNAIMTRIYYLHMRDAVLFHLSAFLIWYGYATFLCIVTNVRFLNGQDNAAFLIQMQKVDRLMGLDKVKRISQILRSINNTSLFGLLFAFLLMFLVACTKLDIMSISFAGAVYAQLTVMVELIYCSNLILYFFLRIRFINCVIKNHLTENRVKNKKLKRGLFSNRNIKKMAMETHDFRTCETHIYMKEIFDLFTMFQDLYRFQLFIFCLKLVFGSLCVFGIILFSIQRNSVEIIETVSMVLFTVIDIFIAIFIGLRLQLFFGEVKENKRLSIAVMAEYSTGPLREKARKMLKMADETPPKLSVYDMYDMDAAIFLSIFSLVTSLIVTLLQFAFL